MIPAIAMIVAVLHLVALPARWARLGRTFGFDEDHFDPGLTGFVRDKGRQFVEGPTMQVRFVFSS